MSGDPIYTEMIIEYSRNPSNFGKIENPHIHRHDSNPLCGDSIDLYANIDGSKISEVKFDGKGCAICMACTSVLTEMIKGKSLEEVKNFKKDDLLAELGLEHLIKTSPVRIKCALLSLKALKHGIYSYFVEKMNDVCHIANYTPVDIVSPYLKVSKTDILTDGLKMGLDYGLTWTCYNGREKACGKCGACEERLEAFRDNNATDPLEYEAH